jgi:hypothetical protein
VLFSAALISKRLVKEAGRWRDADIEFISQVGPAARLATISTVISALLPNPVWRDVFNILQH